MPTLFTPVSAITGGLLIGLAACVLYAGVGRIAGVSNIVDGLFRRRAARDELPWRAAFVLALMAGAASWMWSIEPPGAAAAAVGRPWVILAGVLVGVGARLANGCTSGHGVCGVAGLSRRSLAATAVFLAAGMATVYVLRHLARGVA